ncbi:MAG: hypothetical protein IMZ64_05115 [Bacteroidetes bacterium]|nr:hypothetical protein [Bacteroidota bacterium]
MSERAEKRGIIMAKKKKEATVIHPTESIKLGGRFTFPEEKICYFCKKPITVGINLFNDSEDNLHFKYAPANSIFHIECYLEHAIETIIERKLKDQ